MTQTFQIGPLNHVGVAVPDLSAAIETYRELYGATDITTPFDMPEQGVKVCFVNLPNSQIELIEPLNSDSPIHNFIQKIPGEGSIMSALRWRTSTRLFARCRPGAQRFWVSPGLAPTERPSSSCIPRIRMGF